MNAQVGPAWLEDTGSRVRYRLLRPSSLPVVVGHADWESQNVRWVNTRLHVVHDWDSIVGEREATIAGAASAVFSATGAPNTSASVEQSEAFLKAYAETRGQPWTSEERELAWAAGLWVRVFNAKKATVRPGGETPSPSRLRLEAEVSERCDQAGASGAGHPGSCERAYCGRRRADPGRRLTGSGCRTERGDWVKATDARSRRICSVYWLCIRDLTLNKNSAINTTWKPMPDQFDGPIVPSRIFAVSTTPRATFMKTFAHSTPPSDFCGSTNFTYPLKINLTPRPPEAACGMSSETAPITIR